MTRKLKHLSLIAISLIFTMIVSFPASAADKKEKEIIIEYNELEELIKESNLQIKLNDLQLEKMEDAQDAASDARSGIRDLLREVSSAQSALRGYLGDEELGDLAYATILSLNLSSSSLESQMPNSNNSQAEMAKLGFKQAELNLVNATQNMFILYHQLDENISMLERNRESLLAQYEIAKLSLEHGLIAPSTITDLESSIQEFDANYTALVHQKDSLALQFKSLLGLDHDDDIILGEIPGPDKEYIEEVDFQKDLKEALKNSISIKIKNLELKGSDSKTKKYELQLKENEVTQAFTNQYQLIKEKLDNLSLSETKLNSSLAKFEKEILRYDMGMISLMDYNNIVNELESQKFTVKSNTSSLLMEIEKYEAMINGMI